MSGARPRSLSRDLPPLLRLVAGLEALSHRLRRPPGLADVASMPMARRQGRLVPSWTARPAPADVVASDLVAPSQGGGVPVRTYRPPKRSGPLPVVLYLHGGGWAMGGLPTLDHVCRRLSRDVGALVVSVDYRLAPEHAYPAALEDCAGALEWVRRDAAQLDVDPSRIAVAGDSAGGNLAAALALLDRGNAIPLAAQVLLYPLLDATMDDPWARSYRGPGLQLRDCHELRGLYLGEQAQAKDELVSPLLADSLEGLPATLVVTAGVDVLRDQGRRYAERLLASGVPARWSNYPRAPHGFFGLDRICRDAVVAQQEVAAELRSLLRVPDRTG